MNLRLLLPAILALHCYNAVVAQQIQVPKAQSVKFIENKKQWESNILYRADIAAGAVFLETGRITFDLANQQDMTKGRHAHEQPGQEPPADLTVHRHAYQLVFDGCKVPSQINPIHPTKEYYNYIIGNDHNKWASKAYGFGEVRYEGLYNGVDMKIYSSGEDMKYDFIVAPGGDANQIQLRYIGIAGMEIKIARPQAVFEIRLFNKSGIKRVEVVDAGYMVAER